MKALFGWLSYVVLTVWVATGVLIALSPYFLVTPQNTTLNVVLSVSKNLDKVGHCPS